MTATRSSADVLAWGRAAVDPALRAAVDTLPPSVRPVVAFHFGWCDEAGNPASANNGKAIRPTLALLAAEAAGGATGAAMPAAVAVELVHNFSLLHDDVMDRDVLRRHRPTAWSVFGIGPAILAGDALLALAFDTLASQGGAQATAAARMLGATVQELNEGQALDLAFETRDDVLTAECMRMARGKTGALLGVSCALGQLFGSGDDERVEHAMAFGVQLGLAFQLVDDILGIWGDPAITGKAAHSDIQARKKSLPVVAALASDTDAGRELAALYGREELSDDDVAAAATLVSDAGGRAWSEAEAARQLEGALDELRKVGGGGRAAEELEVLARLVTTRDR